MGFQKSFKLPRYSKGCHLVTRDVLSQISKDLADVKVRPARSSSFPLFPPKTTGVDLTPLLRSQFGMLFLSIKHTSAALTLNENYDPTVRTSVHNLSFDGRIHQLLPSAGLPAALPRVADIPFRVLTLPSWPTLLPSLRDMTMALDTIVPESLPWDHTDEGPDDSVSHTKTALVGTTVSIPVSNGKLNLGTWQGIYLAEFRADKQERSVVATCL